MRQVMCKGLLTAAAAAGVFAATGGYAHAAPGPGSPGLLSGNSVQIPVDVPVDVCGNTVDVLGAGNAATGNGCGTTGSTAGGGHGSSGHGGHGSSGHGGQGSSGHGPSGSGGSGSGTGGSSGHTGGSPGVGSGNQIGVPITVPVNVCGNTVSVLGIGNVAVGDKCGTGGHGTPPPPTPKPPAPRPPAPQPPGHRPPAHPGAPGTPVTPIGHGSVPSEQLAHTGTALPPGIALTLAGGAVLAGAVLYRKARTAR
jgi:hypothetical protein